jgi:hypothetical protein
VPWDLSSNQLYENAWQEIVDSLIKQVYYRLLGAVPVLTDFDTTYAACQYLSAKERGGIVSIVVPGRLAQWDGLEIAPGLEGTPTMGMWIIGIFSRTQQKRTLLLRKGWWTLYLPNYVGAATLIQTIKAPTILGGKKP